MKKLVEVENMKLFRVVYRGTVHVVRATNDAEAARKVRAEADGN